MAIELYDSPDRAYTFTGGSSIVFGVAPYDTWANAITEIGADNATLEIPAGLGNITVAANTPATLKVKVCGPGSYLVIDAAGVTFAGDFEAGNHNVFTGTGVVAFPARQKINCVWFTSAGVGTSASQWADASGTGGIGVALARSTGGCYYYLPAGDYEVTATITVDRDGINIIGNNQSLGNTTGMVSRISFESAANDVLFDLTAGAGILSNCSIKNLYLANINAHDNTAIQFADVSRLTLENLFIYAPTNAWNVGLNCGGREIVYGDRLFIRANSPIVIGDNPNSTIDADAFSFNNVTCRCVSTGATSACVTINSGANLTNISFVGGHESWIGGKYGVYWNDTTSVAASANLTFQNIKSEQADPETGNAFHLVHNAGLYAVTIINCSEGQRDGFAYFRKVYHPLIMGCKYSKAAGVFLNADNTNRAVRGIANYMVDTATINYGTLSPIVEAIGGTIENYMDFLYCYADDSRYTIRGNLQIDNTLATTKYQGLTISGQAGENLVQGEVCYQATTGKYYKADADAAGKYPAMAMAMATIAADASGIFLLYGIVDLAAWSWTIGDLLYLDKTTAGGMTHTPPAVGGDVIQVIGTAHATSQVYFNPTLAYTVVP